MNERNYSVTLKIIHNVAKKMEKKLFMAQQYDNCNKTPKQFDESFAKRIG